MFDEQGEGFVVHVVADLEVYPDVPLFEVITCCPQLMLFVGPIDVCQLRQSLGQWGCHGCGHRKEERMPGGRFEYNGEEDTAEDTKIITKGTAMLGVEMSLINGD